MEKKTYIQPRIKVYGIAPHAILAGSIEVKSGYTSEQNTKSENSWDDIWDEY